MHIAQRDCSFENSAWLATNRHTRLAAMSNAKASSMGKHSRSTELRSTDPFAQNQRHLTAYAQLPSSVSVDALAS